MHWLKGAKKFGQAPPPTPTSFGQNPKERQFFSSWKRPLEWSMLARFQYRKSSCNFYSTSLRCSNGCLVVCDLGRFLISSILLLAFGFSFQQNNTSIFDSVIKNGTSFVWVGFIKGGGAIRLLWKIVVEWVKRLKFQNNPSSLLYPETDSEHHSTVYLQLFLHGPFLYGVPSPTDHCDHCKSRVNAGTKLKMLDTHSFLKFQIHRLQWFKKKRPMN